MRLSARPNERGVLLVVSSPSGAGKTTLCRRLLEEFPNLRFSVSFTTRPPRTGERNGIDYHFVDGNRFQSMIDAAQFAEWAEVHGHRYGTGLAAVAESLERGEDMLFDIDYQGGRQIHLKFPEAVRVFVLPPSIEELERRLKTRATDSEEVIRRRLAKAREELEHYGDYDYGIVNDDMTRALAELRAIYIAAHALVGRRASHAEALLRQWKRS